MKTIIKKTTPLSFALLLVIGSVSMQSHANEDNSLFLSNTYGETYALNGGMRGKPPYNRAKMRRQREKYNQSVEMSAMEIDPNSSGVIPTSQVKRKNVRGGHPDRAKRHSYR